MIANRLQGLLAPTAPAEGVFQPAFVACPAPLFATFNPAQQSFIAEVYRQAQELAQAQLRKPLRKRIPEFSVN
jgi:hypothetical protein